MWAEVLLALIVESYREFMEWWQTRTFLRPFGRAPDNEADTDSLLGDRAVTSPAAQGRLVEESVDAILARHTRRHVGLVVGVCWRGETWTFAQVGSVLISLARLGPTRSSRSVR